MSGEYTAHIGFCSYTGKAKGITAYDMDVRNGTLRERCGMEVDNSSYAIVSSGGKTLYSIANEGVVSFRILQNGNLARLNGTPIRGMRGCHLCTDTEDKYVFASSYRNGKTTVLSLNKDGSVGQIVDKVLNKGYGSVAEYSLRSHVTRTRRMPDGRYALSVDNGTDQVKVYRFNNKGKRLPQVDVVHYDLESAPRHFRSSPDGRFLYLMHELQDVICVYFYETDDRASVVEKIQTTSTTSTRNPGNLTAACVMRLFPDKECIYYANAGENTASIYNKGEELGLLAMIYCLPVSGEYPKDAAVFPDQKYIASINHDGGSISFFEVDYGKGLITICGHGVMVNKSNCCATAKIGNQADKAVGPLIQENRGQHMAGSTLRTILRVTTRGESHGEGIGVVVDGCPAGSSLEGGDIQSYLDRGKPGQSKFTTVKQKGDQMEILSDVFGGRTTGTPIALEVRNTDQRFYDYSSIVDIYHPDHADYTSDQKYGFKDYRSDERFPGREITARVAAGAITCRLLENLGITARAYMREVGGIGISRERFDLDEIWNNRLYISDAQAAAQAETRLEELMAGRNPCGGVVEYIIRGMPARADKSMSGKSGASLAKVMVSIGTAKGFEIGNGFVAPKVRRSENNNGFDISHKATDGSPYFNGRIGKQTNHLGGTPGGISDGSSIVIRAALKPTSSIGQPQRIVNQKGGETVMEIKGRHDPIIVSRVAVVTEAVAALMVADMLLLSVTSRLDRVQAFSAQDRI